RSSAKCGEGSCLRFLDGAYRYDDWKARIIRVEIGALKFLKRKTIEESGRGKDVAMRLDGYGTWPKLFLEKPARRCRSKRPVPGRSPFTAVDRADAGCGQQQDPTGFQGVVQRRDRRSDVIDEMQRLCEHDTVESS